MSDNRQHKRKTNKQMRRRSDLEEERQRKKDFKHRKRELKEEYYGEEEELSKYNFSHSNICEGFIWSCQNWHE